MARPREDHVESETRNCPVHGLVEHRLYANGRTKAGKQRFKPTCPQCHANTELARYYLDKGAS